MPWQLEGYSLQLSAKAASGYFGVNKGQGARKWVAQIWRPDYIHFGTFAKPEEAALAIAKHRAQTMEDAATRSWDEWRRWWQAAAAGRPEGTALEQRRLRVWWDGDKRWFHGVVTSFSSMRGHQVLFAPAPLHP